MKAASNIDLLQNELQNAVLQNLSGAPSSPKEGQSYYNSATKIEYVWAGATKGWRPKDAAALTDGSIALSALATNPLARSGHTGTQTASTISDLATVVQAYRLDQFAAPTTSVSLNSQKITSLATPTSSADAATKGYVDSAVDSAAAGIDSKPSVRVIATSNITLSGLQTIDGITVVANDRVLVTGQSTASQNGVYIASSSAWARATDADTTGEVTPGSMWFIEEGTAYGKTQWRCSNTGTITIGSTSITIVQFGAATMFSADGSTLQLTGTVFSVKLDGAGWLTYSGSGLAIDKTKVPGKYAATVTHDSSTVTFTITHNLGTTDVTVQVRDGSGNEVIVDNQAATSNTVVLTYGIALGVGVNHRVIVHG